MEYIVIRPYKTIYGEFYRHFTENFKCFTDGAANVLIIRKEDKNRAVEALKKRNIDFEFV